MAKKLNDNKAIQTQPQAKSQANLPVNEPVKATPTAAVKPRQGVLRPSKSDYTFSPGEQVAVLNTNGRLDMGYTFVARIGLYDVAQRPDGKQEKVWLNKLVPQAVAEELAKNPAEARKRGAAYTAGLTRTTPQPKPAEGKAEEKATSEASAS